MRRAADAEDSEDSSPSGGTSQVGVRLIAFLESWPPKTAAGVALALAIAVGAAEISSGFEPSLLSLYAIPVALAAWAGSPRTAYGLAAVAVILPTSFSVVAGELLGGAIIWSMLSNFVLLGVIVMTAGIFDD